MAFVEINIPSPLMDFITAHETICVAGCCGEDAFDLTPEAIAENPWTEEEIAKLDLDLARRQLDVVQQDALDAKGQASNDRLNLCWTDRDAINRWCEMIAGLIANSKVHLASKKGTDGGGGSSAR